MITINFQKAQKITRDRLRQEREPFLKELDIQFQRNLETGADNTEVIAEKQRLRDLPGVVDSCTTLDELRSLSATTGE